MVLLWSQPSRKALREQQCLGEVADICTVATESEASRSGHSWFKSQPDYWLSKHFCGFL